MSRRSCSPQTKRRPTLDEVLTIGRGKKHSAANVPTGVVALLTPARLVPQVAPMPMPVNPHNSIIDARDSWKANSQSHLFEDQEFMRILQPGKRADVIEYQEFMRILQPKRADVIVRDQDGKPYSVQRMMRVEVRIGGEMVEGVFTGELEKDGTPYYGKVVIPQTQQDIENMLDPLAHAELRLVSYKDCWERAPDVTIALRKDIEDMADVPYSEYHNAWDAWTAYHMRRWAQKNGKLQFTLAEIKDWAINAPNAPMHFWAFGGNREMDRSRFADYQLTNFFTQTQEIPFEEWEYRVAVDKLKAGRSSVQSERTGATSYKAERSAIPSTRNVQGQFTHGRFLHGTISETSSIDNSAGFELTKHLTTEIKDEEIAKLICSVGGKDGSKLQYIMLGAESDAVPLGKKEFFGKTKIGARWRGHDFHWQGDTEQVKCMKCTVTINEEGGGLRFGSSLYPGMVSINGLGQVRFHDKTTDKYIWVRGTIVDGKLKGRAMADTDFHGHGTDLFFEDTVPTMERGIVRMASSSDPPHPDPEFAQEPPPGSDEGYGRTVTHMDHLSGGPHLWDFDDIGKSDTPWATLRNLLYLSALITGLGVYSRNVPKEEPYRSPWERGRDKRLSRIF